MAEQDYYAVLQVSQGASHEEIKASYRQAVRRHHPDAAPPELKEAAHARIQLINAAWTTLGNASSRADYDEKMRRARAQGEPSPAEPRSPARPQSPTPAQGSGEARKRNLVHSVMGSPAPGRASNPRTKLLAMVFDAAQMYHVEGRPDEASRICQQVLRADPTNAEAAVLLADIYASQNRRAAALDLLERALRLQPSNALYRSKWEALRHSAHASGAAPSPPAPEARARPSGPNPWAKAAPASPLASRLAGRPEPAPPPPTAPTFASEPPAAPHLGEQVRDETDEHSRPLQDEAQHGAGDVAQEPAGEDAVPDEVQAEVGSASSEPAVARRTSVLQRLRSKLSR